MGSQVSPSEPNITKKNRGAVAGTLLFWLLLVSFLSSCQDSNTLFRQHFKEHTGIDFKNDIIENDTHNILNFTNLYTGAGVGIGDFNKDGLSDIFFGANMTSSQLYINKGDFQFENITQSAGVLTDRQWYLRPIFCGVGVYLNHLFMFISVNMSIDNRECRLSGPTRFFRRYILCQGLVMYLGRYFNS